MSPVGTMENTLCSTVTVGHPRWSKHVVLLLVIIVSSSATKPGFPPSLTPGCLNPDNQSDIFCPGDDEYGCFKIPTLLRHSRNGTLIALIEARKFSCDDHGYVDLRLRRSFDSGQTWEASRLVHSNSTESQWTTVGDANVVENTNTGDIWMFHTRNNSRLFLSHSTDIGATWSTPLDVTGTLRLGSHGAGTGHAGGIQLSNGPHKGRLLVPIYSEAGPYVVYSDDGGSSWHIGGVVQQAKGEEGANEWAIAETGVYSKDGTPVLLASRRNVPPYNIPSGISGKGYRLQALSYDGGLSWGGEWEEKQLPEPIRGCEGSLVWHPGTRKLYFSHPNPSLDLLRTEMQIWSSTNLGATWQRHAVVWSGAAGYSSLVVMPDVPTGGTSAVAQLGIYYDRNNHYMAIFEAQSVSFTIVDA